MRPYFLTLVHGDYFLAYPVGASLDDDKGADKAIYGKQEVATDIIQCN